jgi:hypothetical protein
MDAKASNAIHLNLSYEVIYNVIDEEKVEKIWCKLESVYGERFDE